MSFQVLAALLNLECPQTYKARAFHTWYVGHRVISKMYKFGKSILFFLRLESNDDKIINVRKLKYHNKQLSKATV